MVSRYNYYDEGSVLDEDGWNFPDPLKINFNKGKLQKIPRSIQLTADNIAKPWTITEQAYDMDETDDILLMENNVPYIGYLEPGDKLYIPQDGDLIEFLNIATSAKNDVDIY
jgi:hypothetical protein